MEIPANRFRKHVKIFSKGLLAQSKHLSFEGVHDLRVSTRRLRALIRLLEKNTSYRVPEVSRHGLKKLGRVLGIRRQWDVTLKGARKYHLSESALLKDQRAAGAELQKILRRPEIQRLPLELRLYGQSLGAERVSVQKKKLRKIRRELKAWLQKKHFSKNELHKLRVSMKKIRYVFESLNIPVEKLKELQDRLGTCHDLMVLSKYFDQPKQVLKEERQEIKKVQKRIRPALRSSLEVLDALH
jgi:CHAD domain-containing protein